MRVPQFYGTAVSRCNTKLFEVIVDSNSWNAAFTVKPTSEGLLILKGREEALKEMLSANHNIIPPHFRRNLRHSHWQPRNYINLRSIQIRIVNNTHTTFVLGDFSLRGGNWIDFPREVLAPFSVSETCVIRVNAFMPVSGAIRYCINASRGHRYIDISLSQRTQVFKAYIRQILCNEFKVFKHCNESAVVSAVFVHIMDSNPPNIKIVRARLSRYKNSGKMTEITKPVLRIIQEHQGNGCESFDEVQPIAVSSILNILNAPVTYDILLQLTWEIGSETFTAAFDGSQRIAFSRFVVGGRVPADDRIILSAMWHTLEHRKIDEVIRQRLFKIPPPETTDRRLDLGCDAPPTTDIHLTQEEWLDVLSLVLKNVALCFWSAVYPSLDRGLDGISRQHLWRVQNDIECDLQGILEYLRSNAKARQYLIDQGLTEEDYSGIEQLSDNWADCSVPPVASAPNIIRNAYYIAKKLKRTSIAETLSWLS